MEQREEGHIMYNFHCGTTWLGLAVKIIITADSLLGPVVKMAPVCGTSRFHRQFLLKPAMKIYHCWSFKNRR